MRTRHVFTLSLLAFFCLGSSFVSAQEPSVPGPEHAFLKEHAGTWDCVLKAGPEESKCVMVSKVVAGGLWLASEFTGNFGGQAFEGRGLDGFDQNKKKYVGVWVDSMTSGLMSFEGTYDEKTKTMTMMGDGNGPDGKPAKYRTVTTFPDRDHQVFKMYMTGSDGAEIMLMTAEYTRRK